MATVSTEGRIFAAQVTRDLAAREAVGAGLLVPGTKSWAQSLHGFVDLLTACKGPVKAAHAFRAGIGRLFKAQEEGACFVNCHASRSRSGGFELLAWEVAKHPLIKSGPEGVLIHGYFCVIRRNGCVQVGRSKFGFCSWHALARMKERSKIDLFDSRGVVAGCGLAGLLLRGSKKHANTAVYYATVDTLLCAGILRVGDDEERSYNFYDVLTAYEPNEEGPQVRQWHQGCAIAQAVHEYVQSDDSESAGYCDNIEVLPFRHDDHVTRELKRAG